MVEELKATNERPNVQLLDTPAQMRRVIRQLLARSPHLTVVLSGGNLDDNVEDVLEMIDFPMEDFEAWHAEHNILVWHVGKVDVGATQMTLIGGQDVCIVPLGDDLYMVWVESAEHAEHMIAAFRRVTRPFNHPTPASEKNK